MKKYIFSAIFMWFLLVFSNVQNIHGSQANMTLFYDGQAHKYIADEIVLMVDGKDIDNLPMPPVILNDYTLVPAREVFEHLGAYVDWNGDKGLVYIAYGKDLVILQINNNTAYLNENTISMEVAPKIINDKTMIPVRFAAEALGFIVDWSHEERIVSVDTPTIADSIEPPPPETTEAPQTTETTQVTETNETNEESKTTETNKANETENNPTNNTDSPPITNPTDLPIVDNAAFVLAKDISSTPIEDKSYPETSIVNINIASSGNNIVSILASSEISKLDTILLNDNRLILDFYGAEMKTPLTEYTPANTADVRNIRIAQNQIVPEKITRVVLELQNAVNYSISMAADRKSVSVDFEKNRISDISYSTDAAADYITITGTRAPSVELNILSNPDRLVIDLPYVVIEQMEIPVESRFVHIIRAAQFDSSIGRVVLDLSNRIKYSAYQDGVRTIIKLEEPTYKNIWYEKGSKTIKLAKGNEVPINAQSIIKTDIYTKGQYIFTLPGNYKESYGYGDYGIYDNYLQSIKIETVDNVTKITAKEEKVLEALITEDNEFVYITFKNPREVYSKVVVLDPGHGGSDPGTSGYGAQEKTYTLDIGIRLLELLNSNYQQTGIKAYSTRIDDTYISRFDRAPFANEIGDLFVSIHINSAAPNKTPNGTESYYYPHANDSTVGISTKATADIFQKHMLAYLKSVDRKVKLNEYTVLVDTVIPSTLCEIGFLSNPNEAEKLSNPTYRQSAAESLYAAILETFSVYTPKR